MTNQDLLYSTEFYSMLCYGQHGEKESKEWLYVYVWYIHLAVSLKLTQHCKSAVLEKREKYTTLCPHGASSPKEREGEVHRPSSNEHAWVPEVTTVGYMCCGRGAVSGPVKVDDGSGWEDGNLVIIASAPGLPHHHTPMAVGSDSITPGLSLSPAHLAAPLLLPI